MAIASFGQLVLELLKFIQIGFADLSIQLILGFAFTPIAFLIGIPWAEAVEAGSFIGQKLVLNECVAYVDVVANGQQIH